MKKIIVLLFLCIISSLNLFAREYLDWSGREMGNNLFPKWYVQISKKKEGYFRRYFLIEKSEKLLVVTVNNADLDWAREEAGLQAAEKFAEVDSNESLTGLNFICEHWLRYEENGKEEFLLTRVYSY